MPKLYLIPNAITDSSISCIPSYITQEIKDVRNFFVEEPKSARRLLKILNAQFPFAECQFFDLNEHSTTKQIQGYIQILKAGDGAIISEAGVPCVADPGAELVSGAHQNNIEVIPLVGPSSILLALMASGLSGQNFAFNGYLPKDKAERAQRVKALEHRSSKEKQTQIFMETPYRNQSLLEDILSLCQDTTQLCIACEITGPQQSIKTKSIKEWKKALPDLDKKPALFLF